MNRYRPRTATARRQAPPEELTGSDAEVAALRMLRQNGLPEPILQHRFHPTRGWMFDFAWPGARLALEVEGISGGAGTRHQRPAGFIHDCDKYLAAATLGWNVIRAPQSWIAKGDRRIWHPPLIAALHQFLDVAPTP